MLPVPPVVTRPTGSVSVTVVGVEEVERHRDDLTLELRLARAHVALQRVDVREQPERLVHERVVLVVAAVHRPGALARLPERVLLLGHGLELGEEILPGAATLGERVVDGEAVFVRVAHGLFLRSQRRYAPDHARIRSCDPLRPGPDRSPVADRCASARTWSSELEPAVEWWTALGVGPFLAMPEQRMQGYVHRGVTVEPGADHRLRQLGRSADRADRGARRSTFAVS